MRRRLTPKQEEILEAIKIEMSSGKSLGEAAREVMKSRHFNHMTVRRCIDKLARDCSHLNRWVSEDTK